MNYHLNYNLVWKNFDRLAWGLVLSLELAAIGILIGCVIGLVLAVLSHGAAVRCVSWLAPMSIRSQRAPALLVYLVFYGIPSVGGFAYDATTSFTMTLAIYAGAYLVEVFRAAGCDPQGTDRCRLRDRANALATGAVCAPSHHVPDRAALVGQRLHLAVQGYLVGHRAGGAERCGANWIYTNTFRIVEVWTVVAPMYLVTGFVLLFGLRRLEYRFAVRRR